MKLKDLVSFEHSLWKIVTGIVGGIVLLVAVGIWALFLFKPSLKTLLFPPDIPESADVSRVVWLDQNWSEHDRYWFHHVTQGTSTIPMPYDWFVSLEAPELLIFSNPPLLSDPAFLSRLGFISSPRTWETDSYGYNRDKIDYDENDKYNWKNYSGNIDGLPVGFAKTAGYVDPVTGKELPDQLGFNCAACHTGHFNYKGVNVRVDGAPAMADFGKFRRTMIVALAYTAYVPGRMGRFAERLKARAIRLGLPVPSEAKLKEDIKKTFSEAQRLKELELEIERERCKDGHIKCRDMEEGFGRLDALNRIGNQVFFNGLLDLDKPDEKVNANRASLNAPVSFPPIWTTPWFIWAQYDASIQQPLIRNGGEALGVSAKINLRVPEKPLYESSVKFEELRAMENLLQGRDPFSGPEPGFKGLLSPRWPAPIFPKYPEWQIDKTKVEKGRKLYADLCANCHLAPVTDPEFWKSEQWKAMGKSQTKYLAEPEFLLAELETDVAQSEVLQTRRVYVPETLGIEPAKLLEACGQDATKAGLKPGVQTEMPFSLALMAVVEKAVERWMDSAHIPGAKRAELWGDRKNCPNQRLLKGGQLYRARPLNGVWSTAPYLHNGSVPTLWAMLSPENERPKKFCVGNREYDPKKVGYDTTCHDGLSEFDTSLPGNRNTGHRFTAEPGTTEPGWFPGRKLSEDERWELIEFLKTL